MDRTDTAHRAWDTNWQTEAGRAGWTAPEADVAEWAGIARQRGAKVALDLGCGVGRHALMLAGLGFETHALDGSAVGIAHMQGEAAERGLAISAREGMMTELPYADGSFDYVLSFNVIYHGDHAIVAKAIAEIQRVLRPCGLYQGTML